MLRARCLFAKHFPTSILSLLLIFSLTACRFVGISTEEDIPPYPFDADRVWKIADSTMRAQKGWMYADTFTRPYYQQTDQHLLWATDRGIDERADTLLGFLKTVETCGLKASSFHLDEISKELETLRTLKPDSCEESEVAQLLGSLDYKLTEAFMRYVYGQRYGYVRPHNLFNNLLPDTPQGEETRYRRIFDIHCERPNDSLFQVAVKALESAEDLNDLLCEVQPQDALYTQMKEALQEAKQKGDEERQRLCTINLERSRWRYNRPSEEKFVWVNLADFMLTAVNRSTDSILTMKVCGGDPKHKTPLLSSKIKRLELNPYWVIPTSIIRNELIPHHLNDSSYYARNKIVAIHNQSGEESHPWLLSEAQLKSGNYSLRQAKGEGNSLGRMIFRFPNDFAVYLHDTNNPSAFSRTVRALSHGCIRLQRPLDLAIFLMDDPDEYTVDMMRIAIGKNPLGERGKKVIEENPDHEGLSGYTYKPSVPVYLDYYTLYPDFKDGQLRSHADYYGYDKEIERILNQF